MGRASGLWRAHRVEQVLQHSGQSAQSCASSVYSFLPSVSSVRQCLKQESHWSLQSLQTLAHFMKCSACSCWAGADCPTEAMTGTARAIAIKYKERIIVDPLKSAGRQPQTVRG